MAVRAENLVSYQTTTLRVRELEAEIANVDLALSAAVTSSQIGNLKTRRKALEWQAIVRVADQHYRSRRFEEALRGYQKASTMILALVDRKVDRFRRPRRWPTGAQITEALAETSAGLLNHLVPQLAETDLALTKEPIEFSSKDFGTMPAPQVEITQPDAASAISFAERASSAAAQGLWSEAAELFSGALRRIRGQTAENDVLRAEISLNLAAVETQRGEPAAALRHLGRARGLFGNAGDDIGVAEALHNTGIAHLRAGDGEKALKSLDEAKELAEKATLRDLLKRREPAGPPTPTIPGVGPAIRPTIPVGRIGRVPVTTRLPPIRGGSTVIDTAALASQLGEHDLALRFRPISRSIGPTSLPLETPAQALQDQFSRQLTVAAGDELVLLQWAPDNRLTSDALLSVYEKRAVAQDAVNLGLKAGTAEEVAANLPHLYHLVLPIKMADCHRNLGEFDVADQEYRRAAGYRFINAAVEAPDLWRRMAENVQEWGDSLYRQGDNLAAIAVYELLMGEDQLATDSFLYTTASLVPTGNLVEAWLHANAANAQVPDLNPALTHVLHTIRLRWEYLRAGLDFFGNLANVVSPFTFRYLQRVAQYFAQRAIQAEQRYIDFYTRFEGGQMTRKELENAQTLAEKESDAAAHREDAAEATVDLADATKDLADLRAQNAQAALNKFNSAAGQLESLAGHIARGNAWTGSDLPNLDYSGAGYHFDDDKHKVLQQLTKLQTRISNDLQRQRMQQTAAELQAAIGVADAQADIAEARLNAARIETEIADERARHAGEMVEAFNNQFFDPEQWLIMALIMKSLTATALDRAIEVARLMQTAYNFENLDQRDAVHATYRVALANDLLGGELLLSDIDSFTHYHVTRVKEKPIPVKWALSLPEEYPGQFIEFANTGRMDFDIDLERVTLAHPGTYRHLLAGVELEVDGFLPPTGMQGRLTNSGLGRYRQLDGSSKLRLQPAETLVLSRYDRRQDSVILAPPTDMRNLFEGNGLASGWTLEVPRASNDVDLRVVFDIRVVLYFECLYDRSLFALDSQPPPGLTFERTRVLHLRQHFPDAFFQLRETGRAQFDLIPRDFPFNQRDPEMRSLSLAMVSNQGFDFLGTDWSVIHPGAAIATNVTVDANQAVDAAELPVSPGSSALGTYEVALDALQVDRKDAIDDLLLILDYSYTPAV